MPRPRQQHRDPVLGRTVLAEVAGLLALLRRNKRWSSSFTSHPLVLALTALRDRVREEGCEGGREGGTMDPLDVLMPFLDIVRSGEASGPFTGAALKSILCLLRAGVLDGEGEEEEEEKREGMQVGAPSSIPRRLQQKQEKQQAYRQERRAQAASAFVDGLIHCRFEETDAQGDEVVKMRIIELLAEALEDPGVGSLLEDESVWEVVQTCFVNRNEVAHSRQLCHAAEQALFRIIRVVFHHFASSFSSSPSSSSSLSSSTTPTCIPHSAAYGLPCTVKIFGFLSSQLLQGISSLSSSSSRHPYHESTRLICLRLIREALETAGPSFSSCPSLLALVRDDLCLALLKMTRGGFAIEILCEALGVIRCLWSSLRRHLKMQFEVMFTNIFLRLLLQLKHAYAPLAKLSHPGNVSLEGQEEEGGEGGQGGGGLSGGNMAGEAAAKYKPAEQQVILETLTDLLAEPALLPDLFYNYDCDTQRTDVLESLVRALADCCKIIDPDALAVALAATGSSSSSSSSLASSSFHDAPLRIALPGGEDLEHTHMLRQHCMDALLQLLRQLYLRCEDSSPSPSPSSSSLFPPPSPPPLAPYGSSTDAWERKKWKRVLQHGAALFNKKPRLGLQYLASEGALPHLTPSAVAAFLRTAPNLKPEVIGCYLGEVGQPPIQNETGKETYLADTQAFHLATLQAFVGTFDFTNQSLLAALRMFLAAFRLPKEAQQIDRVLQAFATAVFEQCAEGAKGGAAVLAGVDVAYLLSFSVIMLNTDLHNPNIRTDKRMTHMDFYRNNRNYGKDISQGKELPPEYLEGIYKSILEHPILSFDASPEGAMTVDRWRDLVKQAETDDGYGLLVTHTGAAPREGTAGQQQQVQHQQQQVQVGAYDKEVVQWLWRPFLAVAVQAFVGSFSQQGEEVGDGEDEGPGEGGQATDGKHSHPPSYPSSLPPSPSPSQPLSPYGTAFLRQCLDLLLLLAKLTAAHSLHHVFDTLLFLLCGFTGLLMSPPSRPSSDMPWDLQDEELDTLVAYTKKDIALSLRVRDKLYGRLLFRFIHSPSAQMALVSAFGIAHRLPEHIRAGWQPLLLLVFRLRDMQVLGPEVLRESCVGGREGGREGGAHLLSPEGRAAFTASLRQQCLYIVQQQRKGGGKSSSTSSSSTLNDEGEAEEGKEEPVAALPVQRGFLGGLLVSLFSTSGGNGRGTEEERLDRLATDAPEMEPWNGVYGGEGGSGKGEGRWEGGVATVLEEVERQRRGRERGNGSGEAEDLVIVSDGDGHCEGPGVDLPPSISTAANSSRRAPPPSPPSFVYIKSLDHCRALVRSHVASCRVHELIAESRFLGQDALQHLLQTLIDLIQASSPSSLPSSPPALHDEYTSRLRQQIYLPLPLSPASQAFAEVLLAELALRNRDRISSLWPTVLAPHYQTRLQTSSSSPSSPPSSPPPSLGLEKVVTGLLRLCIRLFSHDHLADSMAHALTWLLPPSLPPPSSSTARLFAPLLAGGLSRLVAVNLPSLPSSLSLQGWADLFLCIQFCAPLGGEATGRAFEALCFLLHEPQLKGCVPVTCTQTILSFVLPPLEEEKGREGSLLQGSNDSLARAALDLLMVLHAHLDVMVAGKGEGEGGRGEGAQRQEGVVNWMTILDALAKAAEDRRLSVRGHAILLLTEALLDRQSQQVGAASLARLLLDVLFPLVRLIHATPAAETLPTYPPPILADAAGKGDRSGSSSSNSSSSNSNSSSTGTPPRRVGDRGGLPGPSASSSPAQQKHEQEQQQQQQHLPPPATALKVKELALSMLCSTFLSHLRPLLSLPSFHELWLQLLDVFGPFLSLPVLTSPTLPPSPYLELLPLQEHALEKLKNLLLVMSAAGAFEEGEETIGRELWDLTWAVAIERFTFCPGLREELFGGVVEEEQGGRVVEGVVVPQEELEPTPTAVEEGGKVVGGESRAGEGDGEMKEAKDVAALYPTPGDVVGKDAALFVQEAPQHHEHHEQQQQQQQHQWQQEEGGPPRPIPEGTMSATRSRAMLV
ncbi:hypothetical protein VYU27_007231 [Nannochloropsis oceanica]